jgi:hypothetical protein
MIKSILQSVIAGTFLWLASHSVRLGLENFRPSTLTVKGIAERTEKADSSEIAITVYATDDSLDGVSKSLENSKKKVLAFLQRYGFDPKKVTEGMVNFNDRLTERFNGGIDSSKGQKRYTCDTTLYLQTSKVDEAQDLSKHFSELISQVVFQASVSYSCKKFDSLRPEMLSEALKSARDVAENIARTSGAEIVGIASLNQGNFSVEAGTDSLYKDIRVVSTVVFKIKK